MRFQTIMLTVFLVSCSTTNQKKGLFDNLADKEVVVIYLSKYDLKHVPADIGKLTKAKSLYILRDSATGWTIYPPLSAKGQWKKTPPFRQLPDEITNLSELRNLSLAALDLTQLPDNFGKLKKLDSLDLFMNKLTISNEVEKLKQLKNLKYLVLFGNDVDTADINELKRANPGLTVNSEIK